MKCLGQIKWAFFFFLYIIVFPTHAQVEFHYGPRIGLGLSTFMGPDANGTNSPTGTLVGLYTQTKFSKKISVDAELNYISMGSLFSVNRGTPEERNFKVALGYISLPINFNYCVYKRIHAQVGIQTSAILTGNLEMKYQGVLTKNETISPYQSIDAGPTVGCYYQFEKGLQVGVRCYRGLVNIFKQDYQIYNSGIQLLITYQFSRAVKEL